MNKLPAILATTCFIIGLFSGAVSAKWSLLEDFQLQDLTGDESLCFSSIKDECGFDVLKYTATYPEDDLKDDMDAARDTGYEMIVYDFSFKHPRDPFPSVTPDIDAPVPGEPFFQSSWYTPGFSGWEKLWKRIFNSPPSP